MSINAKKDCKKVLQVVDFNNGFIYCSVEVTKGIYGNGYIDDNYTIYHLALFDNIDIAKQEFLIKVNYQLNAKEAPFNTESEEER